MVIARQEKDDEYELRAEVDPLMKKSIAWAMRMLAPK